MWKSCSAPQVVTDDDFVLELPRKSSSCGSCCLVQGVDDDELALARLVKAELAKCNAEVLMEIPGASVVIVDSGDSEALVESSTFQIIKLAPPHDVAVLFVGESFEDVSGDGFYYPLLRETPVCMSSKKEKKNRPGSHVLTMTARDGDVIGIRLPNPPEEAEQMQALVELLTESCALQIARKPSYTDRIANRIVYGGKALVSGVEWLSDYMSEAIAKGGMYARSKVAKAEEDVDVSEPVAIALATTKFTSGAVVVISTAFACFLKEVAVMLLEETILGEHQEGSGEDHSGPGQGAGLKRMGAAIGMTSLQVLASLVKAGDRVLAAVCNETVAIVGYRYGHDVEQAARNGMGIAKDVTDVLGRKVIKRLAAKGAQYSAKGIMGEPSAKFSQWDTHRAARVQQDMMSARQHSRLQLE